MREDQKKGSSRQEPPLWGENPWSLYGISWRLTNETTKNTDHSAAGNSEGAEGSEAVGSADFVTRTGAPVPRT